MCGVVGGGGGGGGVKGGGAWREGVEGRLYNLHNKIYT